MMKRVMMLGVMLLAAMVAGIAVAQQEAPVEPEQQMPPMGPPEEMKECSWLMGDWEAAMRMRMGPDAPWEENKGTAHYEMVLDGGAMMMTFEISQMPEMPMAFRGMGIQTFDRETNQWQMTWTDNMSCRTSIYTGPKAEGKTVLTGEEMWNGMKMLGRITTYNETPTSFDWMMESSMDGGQTWFTGGEAKYTKVQ